MKSSRIYLKVYEQYRRPLTSRAPFSLKHWKLKLLNLFRILYSVLRILTFFSSAPPRETGFFFFISLVRSLRSLEPSKSSENYRMIRFFFFLCVPCGLCERYLFSRESMTVFPLRCPQGKMSHGSVWACRAIANAKAGLWPYCFPLDNIALKAIINTCLS